jgi:hypothetical protein
MVMVLAPKKKGTPPAKPKAAPAKAKADKPKPAAPNVAAKPASA